MSNTEVEQQLYDQLERLSEERQRQVLAYVQALTSDSTKGVTGKSLLQFGGFISGEELALMTQSIQSDCEQVAVNEW